MITLSLPSPAELKARLPLPPDLQGKVKSFRLSIQKLLHNPQKLLLIVGPCSLYDEAATLEYAHKLKEVSDKIASSCFVVMRAYLEKPRTLSGWKGFLYQSDLSQAPDLARGLFLARQLLLQLTAAGLPLAMEFVNPLSAYYFDDLISWGCIGARTSASQIHRQIASSFSFPIGFKNSVDGNMQLPIQAMVSASLSHSYLGISQEGKVTALTSSGNPHTHLILRGSDTSTNYDLDSIKKAFHYETLYHKHSPILVDCSHGNSKKNLSQQKEVFLEVLDYKNKAPHLLLGLMLESFLEAGSQKPSPPLNPRRSLTDPCLDWDTTEALLLYAHEALSCTLASS
ncbi:MAG: 3-deoxy-7-phosphoheptulonate synthase [Chlamydiae bacterium]|nr:3-deoxy-7-phosphoheptulonate synthase [Chlamydiota bacterium]